MICRRLKHCTALFSLFRPMWISRLMTSECGRHDQDKKRRRNLGCPVSVRPGNSFAFRNTNRDLEYEEPRCRFNTKHQSSKVCTGMYLPGPPRDRSRSDHCPEQSKYQVLCLAPTPDRGTSLMKKGTPLGPYGRIMPRALWKS